MATWFRLLPGLLVLLLPSASPAAASSIQIASTSSLKSAHTIHGFQHPAGWHTAADIARVRSLIASKKEPWKSAVEYLFRSITDIIR